MRPNVIVVVCDTARADAFEPYGAPVGSTPAVADLARRGVTTSAAHSTAGWTLPSHASMFTGLLPRQLGLGAEGARPFRLDDHSDRVLAELLRRAGYSTAAASANPMVGRGRFGAGFERFHVVRGGRRHAPGRSVRERARWARDAVVARIDDGLDEIDGLLRRWLDDVASDQPFFWFVNLMECHSPYLPPRPYNDLGLVDRWRAGDDAARYLSHSGLARYCMGELDAPAATLARMRHLYAAAVRSMDDWLARFLGELDGRGLLDDTLVILTSDHGENLGEGHLLAHGFSIDDRLLRVPFVAAGPGAAALPGGAVASLTGLPVLVADAVGLRGTPWHDDPVYDDVVVAQNDGLRVFGQVIDLDATGWDLPEATVAAMGQALTAISDGSFKLVRSGDRERLFDLRADPLELSDVLAGHAAVAGRLRERLDAIERAPGTLVSGLAAAASTTDSYPRVDEEEEAELEERMRLLGYL